MAESGSDNAGSLVKGIAPTSSPVLDAMRNLRQARQGDAARAKLHGDLLDFGRRQQACAEQMVYARLSCRKMRQNMDAHEFRVITASTSEVLEAGSVANLPAFARDAVDAVQRSGRGTTNLRLKDGGRIEITSDSIRLVGKTAKPKIAAALIYKLCSKMGWYDVEILEAQGPLKRDLEGHLKHQSSGREDLTVLRERDAAKSGPAMGA